MDGAIVPWRLLPGAAGAVFEADSAVRAGFWLLAKQNQNLTADWRGSARIVFYLVKAKSGTSAKPGDFAFFS